MKIAIAQINCTLGDLAGNAAKILDYAERAKKQGATLLLTPELSLCGYPPDDLLLRKSFFKACHTELNKLASRVEGISQPAKMADMPECNNTVTAIGFFTQPYLINP